MRAVFLLAVIAGLPALFWSPSAVALSESVWPDTNAERLRRGLPLKPPVTRTGPFRPRGSPIITLSGYISVDQSFGSSAGFLQCLSPGVSSGQVRYGSLSSACAFSFTTNADGSPFAVKFKTSGQYLAFKAPSTIDGDLTTDESGGDNTLYLESTATLTPAGAKYTDYSTFETSIWSYNTGTLTLSAQWINSDGSPPTTYIAISPPNPFTYATGNVDYFDSTSNCGDTCGNPVTFTFVNCHDSC